MTLKKAGVGKCRRILCDEMCNTRRPPSNIRERCPHAGEDGFKGLCGLLFTMVGKFELLLMDLLCPHEPVTPEKILVILTTFYGILINNSTKGNHHQHLKDKD